MCKFEVNIKMVTKEIGWEICGWDSSGLGEKLKAGFMNIHSLTHSWS
jgi:hypothetical protein